MSICVVLGRDVATKVIEMLYTIEICALRQVSKLSRGDADRWLDAPRAVAHRPGSDPEPSRWLRTLIENGVAIGSIVLDSSPEGMERTFHNYLFPSLWIYNPTQWLHGQTIACNVYLGALICASTNGFADVVEALLSRTGVNPLGAVTLETIACDAYLGTLICASTNGFADVVEVLLSRTGVNPMGIVARGVDTALYAAIRKGHIQVVDLLVRNAQVHVNPSHLGRYSPLNLAIKLGHIEIVRLIVNNARFSKWTLYTALEHAVKLGNLPIVKVLCENKDVDLNHSMGMCDTPITIAAMEGHASVVEFLCNDPRTKIDSYDHRGYNALTMATRRGFTGVVKVLLAHKCSDEVRRNYEEVTTLKFKPKQSALHFAMTSKPEILAAFLDADYIDVNVRDKNGVTPLHEAVLYGRTDAVRMLCGHPDVDINAQSLAGESPLHYVAQLEREGAAEIARMLCAHPRADMNLVNSLEFCDTPITLAAKHDRPNIVEVFCNDPRTNIAACDKRGYSALVVATNCGFTDVVKVLLAHKCDDEVKEDSDMKDGSECDDSSLEPKPKLSALHFAATSKPEILAAFLHADYIDINVRDRKGLRALHYGVQYECTEAVRILCGHPNIDINACDLAGECTLHYAATMKSESAAEIARILCAHPRADMNLVSSIGVRHTPITLAAMHGNLDIVEILCNDPRTNISAYDQRGYNALMVATSGGFTDVVKVLLAQKCDDEVKEDRDGACDGKDGDACDDNTQRLKPKLSVLHFAVSSRPEILAAFLDADYIDVNVRDRKGVRPLHCAIRDGHLEAVRMLCGHPDIDINARDLARESPLHYVAKLKTESACEIARILCAHPRADMGLLSSSGETPLQVALRSDASSAVRQPLSTVRDASWHLRPIEFIFSEYYALLREDEYEESMDVGDQSGKKTKRKRSKGRREGQSKRHKVGMGDTERQ